jgi:hypothetical protein
MSFCDFAVNVEDAIDQGLVYDYQEPEEEDVAPPQLLWLSDIPLFKPVKTLRAQPHSYMTEPDTDSDLQCNFEKATTGVRVRSREDILREMSDQEVTGFRRYRDSVEGGGAGEGAGEGGGAGAGAGEQYGDFRQRAGTPDYDGFSFMDEERDWAAERKKVLAEAAASGPIQRVLEETPDWYEKYSSFLVNVSNPDHAIKAVEKMMLENDDRIDFENSVATYQIRGTLHLQEKPLVFHVNVFKDIYDGEYLVEFQRQSGCPHDFQAFYRQCHAKFKKLGGFLVVPAVAGNSTGIFNFTSDADGVAVASAADFDATKVRDYTNGVTAALNDCSARFSSTLVDVRNEALRSLVLATDELKPFVYNDANITVENVLGILCGATGKLTHVRGLNKEMGRCLAAIAANLCCDKPAGLVTERNRERLDELRKGVHERLVPVLLAFWDKPMTDKCYARRRETDKQIVRLLGILYNDGEILCEKEHEEKMEKRLKSMLKDESPQYKRIGAALQKTVDTLLPKPCLPTRSGSSVVHPWPERYAEEVVARYAEEVVARYAEEVVARGRGAVGQEQEEKKE